MNPEAGTKELLCFQDLSTFLLLLLTLHFLCLHLYTCYSSFILASCSHAQVYSVVHEFHFFYSHTEWNFFFNSLNISSFGKSLSLPKTSILRIICNKLMYTWLCLGLCRAIYLLLGVTDLYLIVMPRMSSNSNTQLS